MQDKSEMTYFVYMTLVMRTKFERFGDFLCLNSMQKKTNKHLWLYIALVVLNDLHKSCVVCESLISGKKLKPY